MFHQTFKRAVYIGIGAFAALGVMRPPLTSAATTQDGDTAAPTDPSGWPGPQAVARYASWSAVFLAPPR